MIGLKIIKVEVGPRCQDDSLGGGQRARQAESQLVMRRYLALPINSWSGIDDDAAICLVDLLWPTTGIQSKHPRCRLCAGYCCWIRRCGKIPLQALPVRTE